MLNFLYIKIKGYPTDIYPVFSYTDDGEYEAYLSDGEYFIGVDLSWLGDEECKEFIDKNKHLFGENKTLCIYFVDYPEDK